MHQIVFVSSVMMVFLEDFECLFSFLQPAALQGGKMAEEKEKKGECGASLGGLGGSYLVLNRERVWVMVYRGTTD